MKTKFVIKRLSTQKVFFHSASLSFSFQRPKSSQKGTFNLFLKRPSKMIFLKKNGALFINITLTAFDNWILMSSKIETV